MWIFRPKRNAPPEAQAREDAHARPALKKGELDAFGIAVALAFLLELVRARSGAVLEPHPGWIAVLVLAARGGGGRFLAGLVAAAVAVGVGSAVAGTGIQTSWNGLGSAPNLIAFGACLTVSWIASWHVQRQADLTERLRAVSDRAAQADATIQGLQGVVARLRARVDRTSTSLSFLRDVATRLDGKDPVAAAEGAADLALARTGACAAQVKVGGGGFQRLLAVRDARGPKALAPLSLGDADVTVPIRNGKGPVGVLALWGVTRSGLDEATAHDLEVIASWCVPALGGCSAETAGPARRAT